MRSFWVIRVAFTLVSGAILAACGPSSEAENAFHPPTLAVAVATQLAAPTATFLGPTETPAPTTAPECVNGLSFLEDVTIPDGTSVAPGEAMDKRWKVKNSGTCNWDARYRLTLIGGSEMGAAKEQALYPARGGTEAVIRMQFVAPTEAGTYRSAWQAVDPDGQAFGDLFFIEVVVQ
jgi:hypothetical protein